MANDSWRSGKMLGWDEAKQRVVPADTLGFDPVPKQSESKDG
jgi:hypothetical protein